MHKTRDVITIGVIGAREPGREIACAAAVAGYRTVLEDVMPEMLEQGLAQIRESLEAAIARGELRREQSDAALAKISTARSVEGACREADLLIEACPDELELKLEIFTLFDRFAWPGAILASSTMFFSIADLAAMTFRAQNCVGLQFYNSAVNRSLVKIVRGVETSEATIAACKEVARRMGREVVVVSEPGQV